jgi:hypothetical protein
MSKKTQPAHMGLYRAQLSCKIAKDALNGESETTLGVSPTDYALYNLLCAVEEIATALLEDREAKRSTPA